MALRLLTLEDLERLPDPEWLVDGLVGENALVELFGKPGTGKSFLALDLAMSVAAGRPCLGQATKQGDVVYVYAEGTTGLKNRVAAWQASRGVGDVPIRFLAQPLDIGDEGKRSEFVKAIRGARQAPRLIVIDTLARCFGAGDENSTKDMNAFVSSLDAIREAFPGATILVVHHSGKNAGKGERGSTALPGAADTVMSLGANGQWLMLKCEKQKDAEELSPIAFRLSSVVLKNGKSSCVIEMGPHRAGGGDARSRLLRNDRRAFEALRKVGGTGALFTEWRAASKLPASTFKDVRRRLVDTGCVEQDGSFYRIVEARPKAETGLEGGLAAAA
jgi:hypothetical protein